MWFVEMALYGMRESSADFQADVKAFWKENGWHIIAAVPGLAFHPELDCLQGCHGDDFYTEGEPKDLNQIGVQIEERFKAKRLGRVGPG